MLPPSVVNRLLLAVVVVVGLSLSPTASAGGGEQEQVKLNAADQAAAKATMIREGDLRPAGGWRGGSSTPDHKAPVCSNFHPKQSDLVVTGSAAAEWVRSGRVIVGQTDVLETTHMVQLDWQRSGTKVAIECSLTTAGATKVAVSRVAFPKLAPIAAAFRASYDVTQGGRTVRLVGEFAAAAHGRSELTVGEFAAASAPLSALHADVVRLSRAMLGRART